MCWCDLRHFFHNISTVIYVNDCKHVQYVRDVICRRTTTQTWWEEQFLTVCALTVRNVKHLKFFLHVLLPMQIQCGRWTSFNFPAVTVTSIRGPAGMYCLLSILSMCPSQDLNWYWKLVFPLQTQRKPETLHSKCPAADWRLKQELNTHSWRNNRVNGNTESSRVNWMQNEEFPLGINPKLNCFL